jgi:hypothetical protein
MGTRKAPDPAVVARRVAAMTLGRSAAHQERLVAQKQLVAGLAGMELEELGRHASTRQWLCAAAECSGATGPEIARIVGLKGGEVSAHRLKRHPVVRRLIELIRANQLQLVLRGQYGTTAQARAAAPEVMSHLSELAGAQREQDGTRRGRAKRDADAIRAGELVLDVAGAKITRHQHQHVHHVVLEQMTDQELEAYAEAGTWPERFDGAVAAPRDFTDSAALPAPAIKGPASPAEAGPRRNGTGGPG